MRRLSSVSVAAVALASFRIATAEVIFEDDFETDLGWTVENDPSLTDGAWERGLPFVEDDPTRQPPPTDYDGSGQCYLTANRPGNSDVDGGPTYLISPTLDLSQTSDPILSYARWWFNDEQDGDPFDVEISNDDGGSWTLIERVTNIPPGWVERTLHINDYITPTSQMKIRFSAMDNPNNSKDEGGIDAVSVIPEPSSVILLAAASLFALRRRRQAA